MNDSCQLNGPRFEIDIASAEYPAILRDTPDPPRVLRGIGNPGRCHSPATLQDTCGIDTGHLANEIDSILERPSELCLVVIDLMLAAATTMICIAQISTWARVGCGNELKARGKHRTRTDPTHDHLAVLDGLAQSLQGTI